MNKDSMLEDQELREETKVPASIDEGHAVDICMHLTQPGLSTSETCMLQLLSKEISHSPLTSTVAILSHCMLHLDITSLGPYDTFTPPQLVPASFQTRPAAKPTSRYLGHKRLP